MSETYSLLAVLSSEDTGRVASAAAAALEALDPPHGLRVSDPHLTVVPVFGAPGPREAAFVGGYADVRGRTATLGEPYFWPDRTGATVLAVRANAPWLERERERAATAVEMVGGKVIEPGVDPHVTLVRTGDPQDPSWTMPQDCLTAAAHAAADLTGAEVAFSRAVAR